MACLVRNRPLYLALITKRCCHTAVAKSPVVTQPLNFLDGQRVEPLNNDKQQQFPLIYPATGEVLKTVQSSGASDLDNAMAAARRAQKQWAGMSGFERGQVLKRAADLCRVKQEELARAETLDTGKPIWEARFDIQGCADSVEYYGGLASTISGEFLQLSGGNFAYTIREPLGVVGGIGAWNYPFQMATWKSAPALACGNAFVFKPSQMTPLTAVMLGEIYKEAGLPDGCYNVVQ
ncbi:4-trimethylaminobutyraldehyde dehydrogenase A-like, partial [Ruditapes philippinarum]|uniref:4-trimethylaminobutyraldehyde dehydrogenase A-like n=1 Tax=Ruditapes philippinarum TaxID=129788 RepID=UPI00295B5539